MRCENLDRPPIEDPDFESEAKIFWKDNLKEGGHSDPGPTSWCNWSPVTCGTLAIQYRLNLEPYSNFDNSWYFLDQMLQKLLYQVAYMNIWYLFEFFFRDESSSLREAIFCTGICIWWISPLQVHHKDATGYIDCLFACVLQSLPCDDLLDSLHGFECACHLLYETPLSTPLITLLASQSAFL